MRDISKDWGTRVKWNLSMCTGKRLKSWPFPRYNFYLQLRAWLADSNSGAYISHHLIYTQNCLNHVFSEMAKLFFRPLVWHLLCSNHVSQGLSAWLISQAVTNTQSKHSVPHTVLLSKDCPCFILQCICIPIPLFLSPFHWIFEFTVIFAGTSTIIYTCWNSTVYKYP